MQLRIRTVKPELLIHEELYQLEIESGLPVRLGFIGLFLAADREGRFNWRPVPMKTQLLPYDKDVNFEHVLEALAAYDFIRKYEVDGKTYGFIPTWHMHQTVNAREAKSKIPAPPKELQEKKPNPNVKPVLPEHIKRIVIARAYTCITCKSKGVESLNIECRTCSCGKVGQNVDITETHVHAHGEQNRTERNRTRTELERNRTGSKVPSVPAKKAQLFIARYCELFKTTHHTSAEILPKDAGLVKSLVKNLSEEKIYLYLEAFFKLPDAQLKKERHPITKFQFKFNEIQVFANTNQFMTNRQVQQADVGQTVMSQLQRIKEGKL